MLIINNKFFKIMILISHKIIQVILSYLNCSNPYYS